jgi:hypothetical protein
MTSFIYRINLSCHVVFIFFQIIVSTTLQYARMVQADLCHLVHSPYNVQPEDNSNKYLFFIILIYFTYHVQTASLFIFYDQN